MAGGEQTTTALRRLDDELICGICREPYQDPRLLPCSHYYCRKCIDEYAARAREEGKELLCPECRDPVEVHDASALRPAHFLNRFRDARDSLSIAAAVKGESSAEESTPARRPRCSMCSSPNQHQQLEAIAFCSTCERFLCAFCVNVHHRAKDYDGHNITIAVEDPALVATSPSAHDTVRDGGVSTMCPKHSDEKRKVFCSEPQCMEFICVQCAVTNHSGHQVEDADEKCVEKCKRALKQELEPMNIRCKQLSSVVAKIEARESEVSSQSSLVANRVHECFDQLAESISGYRNRVLEQLYKIEEEKMSSLRAQEKTLKVDFSDLSTVVHEAEGVLVRAKYQPDELLSKMRQILDCITTTVQQRATVDTRICVDANIDLSINDSLLQNLEESYCQIQCKLPDPAFCTISGYGVQTATTGQEARFYLSLAYGRDHPCTEQYECDIAVTIQPVVATGEAIKTSIRSATDGQYTITYTPKVRGKHEIVVSVRGKEIQGSPFQLLVAHHPSSLRPQREKAIHVFCRMDGLTMSDSEQLVLSEKSKAEVSYWDKSGRKLGGIKVKTHLKDVKLSCPTGVEVDQHGHIYVADNQAHCLMKFSKEGSHLVSCFPKEILEMGLTNKSTNKRDIHSPGGIRINHKDEVLVCDCNNHRILIFDQDLNNIGSFGKKGEREGEFNWPVDMVLDLAGNVYVSDMDNHRIQVFNIKWEFIREFGTEGKAPGQLGQPTFMFLDRNGYLYISENINHRVSVFQTTGEFVTILASPTSEGAYGKDWFPKGITMDSDGLLYVADRANQLIHVF